MTPASSEAVDEATRRVERWLLTSSIQISDGPQRGGIAGWLDAHGEPEFVYLEITGYYLTSMAWLIAGGARGGESGELARERGQRAAEWLAGSVSAGRLPPTRLYLARAPVRDWRNDAVFSFDLAMAARGLATFDGASGRGAVRPAQTPAALLRPGDRVRFRAITPEEFSSWR